MSEMDDSTIQKYLLWRSNQLFYALGATEFFAGSTESGDVAESALRTFFHDTIPGKFSVGKGEILAVKNEKLIHTQSKDVVIYDSSSFPIFSPENTGARLFPIESVLAVIEVKKTINTRSLVKAMQQAVEVRSLINPGDSFRRPYTAVVSLSSSTRLETLVKAIQKLEPKERPDFVLLSQTEGLKNIDDPESQSLSYITHAKFEEIDPDKSAVRFCSSYDFSIYSEKDPNLYKLIWGTDKFASLWFYLNLVTYLGQAKMLSADMWKYTAGLYKKLADINF